MAARGASPRRGTPKIATSACAIDSYAPARPRRGAIMTKMNKRASPDEVLQQIRAMSIEDREYVEAELMREAYESGRRAESPELITELKRRAEDALANPERAVSREEAIANARAAAVRAREG